MIDGRRRLIGVVSLRTLLTTKRSATLADVMSGATAVTTDASLDDISDLFNEHPFLGIPVADEKGPQILLPDAWIPIAPLDTRAEPLPEVRASLLEPRAVDHGNRSVADTPGIVSLDMGSLPVRASTVVRSGQGFKGVVG